MRKNQYHPSSPRSFQTSKSMEKSMNCSTSCNSFGRSMIPSADDVVATWSKLLHHLLHPSVSLVEDGSWRPFLPALGFPVRRLGWPVSGRQRRKSEKVWGWGRTMLVWVIDFCGVVRCLNASAANFFSIWLFHKFFMSLPVLPGSLPAISDHLHQKFASI